MNRLKQIYRRRFEKDIEFRKNMWKFLCDHFLQKYIQKESTVLDVAAGYCEFINNIRARKKIALDYNPDIKKFAENNVKVIISNSTKMKKLNNNCINVVFTSNFFEHLTKEDIVKTIMEIHRVLKKDGKFLIIQPNIRFCYRDYWMFFDHITPLDDRSLSEVLELNGFKIIEIKSKFLPYTTKSKLPKSIFLFKLYLKIPIIQKIMGKQLFIYAKKV